MNLPTPAEINSALGGLGNWRVLHVQEALYPYRPISASVMLALGFRETGLKNICGGATWDGSKWVRSYTDRGWLQISASILREAEWLRTQEGCPNGSWTAVPAGHNALEPMHCPRFSPALDFTKATMFADMAFAQANAIPAADLFRFAVAAHNAGPTGALHGYREGDVDKHTAGGDYSHYVFAVAPMIHDWIVGHPNWVYHPS